MQAVHQGVDPGEGEEHHRHGDHRVPRREGPAARPAQAQVQIHRVDDPGDQGPLAVSKADLSSLFICICLVEFYLIF